MFKIDHSALATVTAEALNALASNRSIKDEATRRRWRNAIKKAHRLLSQPETSIWRAERVEGAKDGLVILSTRGPAYHATADGKCQCEAWEAYQPCWHRAATRLIIRYDEKMRARIAPIVLDTPSHRAALARALNNWTPKPHARRTARAI